MVIRSDFLSVSPASLANLTAKSSPKCNIELIIESPRQKKPMRDKVKRHQALAAAVVTIIVQSLV
ncbi:hypothetical protein MARINON1_20121 [Marinobacter salarius]|nr:hypothetical protein MBHK15_90122 [Marinobacter salarius]VXA94997.1 hypothetical protein MARINON1_20121 [Marinobacter salarius]